MVDVAGNMVSVVMRGPHVNFSAENVSMQVAVDGECRVKQIQWDNERGGRTMKGTNLMS
jgi:hypothetical protein